MYEANVTALPVHTRAKNNPLFTPIRHAFSVVQGHPWQSINHCYHVNDCRKEILLLWGDAHLLRHCWPFIIEVMILVIKGGTYFFYYKKYVPAFTNKNILLVKGGTYFF